MKMLKGTGAWQILFAFLVLTAASSVFNPQNSNEISKFASKKLVELSQQGHLYKPVRVHTEINSGFLNNSDLSRNLQTSADLAAEIMSEFLFVKPLTTKLKLSEKSQCNDVALSQTIQKNGVYADLAIFLVPSEGVSMVKQCESDSAIIYIDTEEFEKLGKIEKINEICKAIVSFVYGKAEEGLDMAREIEEYLGNLSSSCSVPHCAVCPAE